MDGKSDRKGFRLPLDKLEADRQAAIAISEQKAEEV